MAGAGRVVHGAEARGRGGVRGKTSSCAFGWVLVGGGSFMWKGGEGRGSRVPGAGGGTTHRMPLLPPLLTGLRLARGCTHSHSHTHSLPLTPRARCGLPRRCLAAARAGVTMRALQSLSVDVLSQGIVELGLRPGVPLEDVRGHVYR